METATLATSPRLIINCTHCKTVTGRIELDISSDRAHRAYILGGEWVRCPACNYSMMADAVRGTYNASRKCKTSCVNAKRGDCECSCGGRDHGIYA
jgi:hypothetical protein